MIHRPKRAGATERRSTARRIARSFVALFACGLAGCPLLPDPAPLPTVKGPESPELRAALRGTLLYHTRGGGFHAVDLASGAEREHESEGRIWQLDGPDARARCVLATEHGSTVDLVLFDLRSGNARTLASHRGRAPFWEQSAFSDLCLSDDGEFVAYRRAAEGIEFDRRHELGSGVIEILTTSGESVVRLEDDGFSSGMDWRAGEDQLFVARSVEVADVPDELGAQANENGYETIVFVYDVSDDSWTPLCVGWEPRSSPDGTSLLIQDGLDAWSVFDLDSGERRPVRPPGMLAAQAILDHGVVLYTGLPTEGAETGVLRTLQKPPQAMWTLKVADPTSGAFVTVLPEVGRFHAFACGASL